MWMNKTIFTEDQLQDIVQEYNRPGKTGSFRAISRKYNCTKNVIKRVLQEIGIKLKTRQEVNRNYQFDTAFFNKIDTFEKAYWLGFLYADGCVKDRGYVQLASAEIEPIEKFKKSIKAEHPIVKEANNRSKYNNSTDVLYFLRIGSKSLVDQLAQLGCTSRKTFSLKFPTKVVPSCFMWDFIRGYFDGDGSLCLRSNGRWVSLSISCTEEFGIKLTNFVNFSLKSDFLEVATEKEVWENLILIPDKSIYSIRSRSSSFTKLFLRRLYQGAQIYLNRKKILAEAAYAN
jgi:hypothetical protein